METEFYIGQIFEGKYPPEAAAWCNSNDAHIEEITKEGAEQREFTIVENVKPIPTKAELTAFISAEADKIAYGGFTIIANGQEYLFKTTTDNITRCNSVLAMYEVLPDDTVIPWEVWQGDTPAMLPVNKTQFKQCFAFGANMIISVETVKGTLNAEIQSFTDEQLADSDNIAEFKARATATLEAVPRVYDMTETVTESDSGDSDGENTDTPNKETETE